MADYVISLEEVLWGGLLLAVTMGMHGMGMLATLRVTDSLKERTQRFKSIIPSLGIVILGSLMIIVTSLVEIIVWAAFFLMMGALSNHSSAFYYALVNYTTLERDNVVCHLNFSLLVTETRKLLFGMRSFIAKPTALS